MSELFLVDASRMSEFMNNWRALSAVLKANWRGANDNWREGNANWRLQNAKIQRNWRLQNALYYELLNFISLSFAQEGIKHNETL